MAEFNWAIFSVNILRVLYSHHTTNAISLHCKHFKKMITKTISIIVKKGWKYKLTQTICIVFLFLFFLFFNWSTIHKAYLCIRTIIFFLFFLWLPTITRPLFVTKKTLLSKLNTLTNMHTHIMNNLKDCKCKNSFSPPKFSPHHI